MKKAMLFGASGFIGSYLLTELLNSDDYKEVIIVVRKSLPVHHPKLKMLTGDFHSLPGLKDSLVADDVFIALGTTKKNTPDPKAYYEVDHDYPVLAARIARENGAKSVFLVTAVGANDQSSITYVRTKGEVERDIIALGFDHTHIFRPSMLMGNRTEHRTAERLFMSIWKVVNPLLAGKLDKYKGISGQHVAQAMAHAVQRPSKKVNIYHWREMNGLVAG